MPNKYNIYEIIDTTAATLYILCKYLQLMLCAVMETGGMATVRGRGSVDPWNSAFHSCFVANKTWKNIIITITIRES